MSELHAFLSHISSLFVFLSTLPIIYLSVCLPIIIYDTNTHEHKYTDFQILVYIKIAYKICLNS